MIELYTDGGCTPTNPGGYATWGWIAFEDGREIESAYGCVGHGKGMTNNVAEYQAVIHALEWAHLFDHRGFHVRADANLIVFQVQGKWKCKSLSLRPLAIRARQLLELCEGRISWIPREENWRADALTRVAYREARLART